MESQVTIDIGGEKTVRVNADLFSLPGIGDNKFAAMLSDRWQGKAASKDDCTIFVDYSPKVFMPLIEWLRLVRDSEPRMNTPVKVDPAYLTPWIRMMIASAFHPQVFRKANLTGKDLCEAGCSLRLCIEAGLGPDCFENVFLTSLPWGFKPSELKETGLTAAELREAGFTDLTLLARAGFCTSDLEAAGFGRSEAVLASACYSRPPDDLDTSAAALGADVPHSPPKAPPWPWGKGSPKGLPKGVRMPFGLGLKGKGKGIYDYWGWCEPWGRFHNSNLPPFRPPFQTHNVPPPNYPPPAYAYDAMGRTHFVYGMDSDGDGD